MLIDKAFHVITLVVLFITKLSFNPKNSIAVTIKFRDYGSFCNHADIYSAVFEKTCAHLNVSVQLFQLIC